MMFALRVSTLYWRDYGRGSPWTADAAQAAHWPTREAAQAIFANWTRRHHQGYSVVKTRAHVGSTAISGINPCAAEVVQLGGV